MFANPMMVMPLAVYRYWLDVIFSAQAKTAEATSAPAEITIDAKQPKKPGRRPAYISARIQKARRHAV